MNREQALAVCDAEDWATRAEAAEILATFDDDEAATAMGWLLLDADNVGVVQRAAEALVNRNDVHGTALVFAALALCDNQRSDTLVWVLGPAYRSGVLQLVDHARTVLEGDNPWARHGARDMLKWLHLDSDP
jgi:hypothetical protein